MVKHVILGMTIIALFSFIILALMGTTVSAWYVVIWILPTLSEQIYSYMIDRS
jgi:hypothetical protein